MLSTAFEPAPAKPAPLPATEPARPARGPRIAARVALGLVVGLGITEGAFRYRDGGAFPLVNIYQADPTFGVKLKPGSVTRVGKPGERVTTVRVNAEGFRGPEWPAPSKEEIIVIGDSQTFGLGVEDDEALAARLGASLPEKRAAVLDASVPTYGPNEYLKTLEGVLAKRIPNTVVIAVNLINDLSEIERPNPDRYTAVDGWAVRREAAGALAGRSGLYEAAIQSSHAAFALWRWQRTRDAIAAPRENEPRWDDVLKIARSIKEGSGAGAGAEDAQDARGREIEAAKAAVGAAQAKVTATVKKYMGLVSYSGALAREWEAYWRSNGDPDDQVFTLYYGGCDFNPRGPNTFQSKFRGPRIRQDVEESLRMFIASHSLAPEFISDAKAALDERSAAEQRLRELESQPAPAPKPAPRPELPIKPLLSKMNELAGAHGSKLVLLTIPLVAQIDRAAQEASGMDSGDVEALRALAAEITAEARDLGAIGVDPSDDLARAGGGAYLPGGHLSAAGHDIVAKVIARAITAEKAPPSAG